MNPLLLLKLIPGLNLIAPLAGAVVGFLGSLVRWTWKGIEDCFTHPATFLVCAMFAIGGAYGMAKYIGHRVKDLKVELSETRKTLDAAVAERNQWRTRYAQEEERAKAAETARAAAEAKFAAAGTAARRVQQGSPAASKRPSQATQSSVFGFAPLQW